MKFSQRMGITPTTKSIQIESLDVDLRNGLWNIFNDVICKRIGLDTYSDGINTHQALLAGHLWHNIYKLPTDTIPDKKYILFHIFRKKILESEWFHSLELIEEVVGFCHKINLFPNGKNLEKQFNEIFEREFSAYRFIDGIIVQISNAQEISGIETALFTTDNFTALKGCNIHLKMALNKISDRINPDYRNSIKESISAVESLAKVISGKQNDTLGASLDRIKGTLNIHNALERGFKLLYGYTSDEGGIRHALMETPNCDFEDAKYMLVSCSAFINYLISKANKAGISF